jgi:hypothetical protein
VKTGAGSGSPGAATCRPQLHKRQQNTPVILGASPFLHALASIHSYRLSPEYVHSVLSQSQLNFLEDLRAQKQTLIRKYLSEQGGVGKETAPSQDQQGSLEVCVCARVHCTLILLERSFKCMPQCTDSDCDGLTIVIFRNMYISSNGARTWVEMTEPIMKAYVAWKTGAVPCIIGPQGDGTAGDASVSANSVSVKVQEIDNALQHVVGLASWYFSCRLVRCSARVSAILDKGSFTRDTNCKKYSAGMQMTMHPAFAIMYQRMVHNVMVKVSHWEVVARFWEKQELHFSIETCFLFLMLCVCTLERSQWKLSSWLVCVANVFLFVHVNSSEWEHHFESVLKSQLNCIA